MLCGARVGPECFRCVLFVRRGVLKPLWRVPLTHRALNVVVMPSDADGAGVSGATPEEAGEIVWKVPALGERSDMSPYKTLYCPGCGEKVSMGYPSCLLCSACYLHAGIVDPPRIRPSYALEAPRDAGGAAV